MSFKEAYEEFKIYAMKRHKKQSFDCFAYNFNANILAYFNNKALNDIKSIDILKWQEFVMNKNFCNNHNKNLYSMLKSFLSFCRIHYDFDDSILLEIGSFKQRIEVKKTDFYTLREFKNFIRCVDNSIYKQFFNLMFYCGTRPGEAMALKFSDLLRDYIIISKTIDEHGSRSIGTPKTLSSNRKIKIDKNLEKDLLELKKYYVDKYKCDAIDYFIFGGIKPLSPTTINRYKLKACNKAKIRPITLHQFRHSHATLLLNKGIVIHEISRRLGHNKVSTTLDVYTHSNLEQEKRVYKTLNSMRYSFFGCFAYNFKKIISILKHITML